jgi:hypothetical protein
MPEVNCGMLKHALHSNQMREDKQEKSMLRIVLGVLAGFFAWAIVWVASEKILSAILPNWYGAHQRAFEAAVANGGQFTASTRMLLIHIVLGSIVSVMSGFLAALIAVENKRAPLVLGFLLLAFGLVKVVLSWSYVPLWYHVIFTALLIPMTILGGKLKTTALGTSHANV